jgi:hypothetical protein
MAPPQDMFTADASALPQSRSGPHQTAPLPLICPLLRGDRPPRGARSHRRLSTPLHGRSRRYALGDRSETQSLREAASALESIGPGPDPSGSEAATSLRRESKRRKEGRQEESKAKEKALDGRLRIYGQKGRLSRQNRPETKDHRPRTATIEWEKEDKQAAAGRPPPCLSPRTRGGAS